MLLDDTDINLVFTELDKLTTTRPIHNLLIKIIRCFVHTSNEILVSKKDMSSHFSCWRNTYTSTIEALNATIQASLDHNHNIMFSYVSDDANASVNIVQALTVAAMVGQNMA